MATLTIKQALLSYDAPLVVLATDKKSKLYIGVNFSNEQDGYSFYFSRAKVETITGFLEGTYDLLYILTRRHVGKYQIGVTWGTKGEQFSTKAIDTLDSQWLPKPGVFMPAPPKESSTASRVVHIDGRWGINDLRKFSDLVQDCYAFVFALTGRGTPTTRTKIASLFQKYPWRGGFSAVNFFDDLYRQIPMPQRASIKSIAYASPGTIELQMNAEAADAIRRLCKRISQEDNMITDAYEEAYDWLRERNWLGNSASDLRLTTSDRQELMQIITTLTDAFGLSSQKQYLLELSSSDPLGAVKILLAYYRRLERLADYVATGKASSLFSNQ